MAREYGVLVWVHEDFLDSFTKRIANDPDVTEYEITEDQEFED